MSRYGDEWVDFTIKRGSSKRILNQINIMFSSLGIRRYLNVVQCIFIGFIRQELLLLFPVLPEGMVPTGFPIRSLTKGILFYFY